ncbi:uncharacterized protein SOCE26_077170 [Sorangium cellulosum]|uniref:Thiaminase-2/PQQC domain-containing protein n=1 Tax=Sorangium cellulosum TaxID=56 RepID=A0A2L0F3T2_SORCE|nr:hypothetical protein [Sorangium cellulosum]AUX46212.1 uncharacterized protein SOCE26_077170 [Sorangium cellulosum]
MAYNDLNKHVIRNESKERLDDPLQRMLNINTYEEDLHWMWMLDDLDKLGVNTKLALADSTRVLWSPDMRVSRQLCLEFTAIAARSPSFGVFAMVESIEAVSVTIFKHCRGIALENGVECEFFGTKHYKAETAHHIKSEGKIKASLPALTEEQRAEAKAVVDRVFELFYAWSDSLLEYARKYSAAPVEAYAQMIDRSHQLPRRVVLPEYARG